MFLNVFFREKTEEDNVAFQRYESKTIIKEEFKSRRRVETDPKGEASQNKSHSFHILSLILTKIDRIKNSFVSKTHKQASESGDAFVAAFNHPLYSQRKKKKKHACEKKKERTEKERETEEPTNLQKNRGKIEKREKKADKTTREKRKREREKPRQKFTRCAKEQEGDVLCVRQQETGGLTREASGR